MTDKHPLTTARARKRISIADFAEAMEVDRVTVWRWEKGRLPAKDYWPKITQLTGVKPEALAKFAAKVEPRP